MAARRVCWLVFGSLTPLLPAWGIVEHRGSKNDGTVTVWPMRAAPSESDRAAALNEPHSPPSFRISGRVVDPYGDPIADAEVWLEDMGAESGTSAAVWLGTDSDGRFLSPRARAGLYTITAAARGFGAHAIAMELDADVSELRLALALAPSPRVVVVDPEGRPVSDAVVVACPEPSAVTLRSASDGTVAFGPGAIGCFATAHHARFSRSPPARLEADGHATLRLERGGAIEGVVSDLNGRTLSDAEVSIQSFDPSESEQPLGGSPPELRVSLGRDFRFSGLAPGTYNLAVIRRIHVEDGETSEELAAASFEVVAGRVVRGVHIVTNATDVSSPETPSVDPT